MYWPFNSLLKTLSLYPNSHSSLEKVWISPDSKWYASNFSKTSFISTPYAPIFCIGLAPTLPGIKDKFSTPHKPTSIHFKTNSCQTSPEPAFTIANSFDSSIISNPLISFKRTSPSKWFFTKRTLLPPPKTNNSFFEFSFKIVSNSSTELNRPKKDDTTSIPNVL